MSKKIILGKFGAAYGVRGWLHLISYTDPIDNIFHYPQWQVLHHHEWKILRVENKKIHGKGLIVKLQEINDRELAREYTNDKIYIEREALPTLTEEEYYWEDLIGLTVITEKGIILGIVKELIATGSNDVFVVTGDRERLIPYIRHVVIKIDKNKKTIIVNWDPEF